MGLFNFTSINNADSSEQSVVLAMNAEQVEVSAAEAVGKTIAQLFSEFASNLGDTSRINRYVDDGAVVDGSTVAAPGHLYRGAVTSESKG